MRSLFFINLKSTNDMYMKYILNTIMNKQQKYTLTKSNIIDVINDNLAEKLNAETLVNPNLLSDIRKSLRILPPSVG